MMSSEERAAWINIVASTLAYAWYIQHVLRSGEPGSLTQTPYLWPLVIAAAVSIGLAILGQIVFTIITRERTQPADVRDKSVSRRADYNSHWVLYVGGFGVIALAILDVDGFWIGNAMYLTMFVSSLGSKIFRIVYYRRGLPA